MEQFPMPPKNVSATLMQKWPDDSVKLNLKGKLSDIERNILGSTKYIADNFDKLFDENKKLQVKIRTYICPRSIVSTSHGLQALLKQRISGELMLSASCILNLNMKLHSCASIWNTS